VPRRQVAGGRRACGRPAGGHQGAGRRRSELAAPAASRDRRVPDLRRASTAGARAPAGAHRRAPHRRDGTAGGHHPGQRPLPPDPHQLRGRGRDHAGRPVARLAAAAGRVPAGVRLPQTDCPLPRRRILHPGRSAGGGAAARPVRPVPAAQPRRSAARQHGPAAKRRVGAARLGVHRPLPARVRPCDAQRAAGRHARRRRPPRGRGLPDRLRGGLPGQPGRRAVKGAPHPPHAARGPSAAAGPAAGHRRRVGAGQGTALGRRRAAIIPASPGRDGISASCPPGG